jgi:hypothetical protein
VQVLQQPQSVADFAMDFLRGLVNARNNPTSARMMIFPLIRSSSASDAPLFFAIVEPSAIIRNILGVGMVLRSIEIDKHCQNYKQELVLFSSSFCF